MALIVGMMRGVGAVLFRYLIRGVEWVGYRWTPAVTSDWGRGYVVFVPAGGGLLVGLLVYFFAREAKGHGVPEVMQAVALRGGRIRPIVALVKSLASAIAPVRYSCRASKIWSWWRSLFLPQIGSRPESTDDRPVDPQGVYSGFDQTGWPGVHPHGDTVFQAGNHVTAYVMTSQADTLFQSLHGRQEG